MKPVKNIFLLVFIFFVSCDSLDVKPLVDIDESNAIKDKKGLLAALNGVYDQLQGDGITQDAMTFGDLAADNLIHIGTKVEYRQISENRILSTNSYVEGLWNESYDAINQVNNIFTKMDEVTSISEQDRDEIEAQLFFLRAFNYANLVKYFGGVPIKTEPTRGISDDEIFVAPASSSDVYQFIIEDLLTAENLSTGVGKNSSVYADEGAVKALLARMYLYTGQWQAAADKAEEVLGLGYELVDGDQYASIFDESVSNDEIIFQIDFYNDFDDNAVAEYFLPDVRFEVAVWNTPERQKSLYTEYEETDKRRDASIGITNIRGSQDFYCNKYNDIVNRSDNIIILRLSEIYLIAAEALNEVDYLADGEAFSYLNIVRERAGLNALSSADLPDQEAFRLAIEKERRLELAFEGHRYIDLVRTNRARDVLPQIGPLTGINEYLFPIPQSEMDTNDKMIQNPGY